VQRAVWRPLRLENGFVRGSGNPDRRLNFTRSANRSHPKFGAGPGHVRVIPRQPRQVVSIRTNSRVGVKVLSLDQNLFRLQSVARDRSDGINHHPVGSAVVFPHTDQAVPRRIDHGISIPALGRLANSPWRLTSILSIEFLIDEIAKVNGSLMDQNSAATVLMDKSPCVEMGGRKIMSYSIRCVPYDNVTATLLRSFLDPANIVSV
jgi:hypothetical protein